MVPDDTAGNIISIHALREEGDRLLHQRTAKSAISIHALREEGDLMMFRSSVSAILFLSTPSARRATGRFYQAWQGFFISINALREEGDSKNRDKISIFL